MKKNIIIVIINFNGEKFLKKCLNSLVNQDFAHKEIVVIDNGSGDNSLEIIQQFKEVELIINEVNNGYSGAADQCCHMAVERKKDYLMILNPDIVYENNYITKVINHFEADPKIAAAQGKLLKYDFDNNKKVNMIDSVGLFCYKNRRIIDRGQGLKDEGQYDKSEDVFGITGATPIYRVSALEEIKVPVKNEEGEIEEEYFDRDFFMYKEDIDISWRFLLAGFKNYYCADAIAYHGRGTGVLKRFTHLEVLKNRKGLPKFTKAHSYKNQRLMQVKNEIPSLFFRHFFPIIIKEILITGYIVFREPFLIKSFLQMLKALPKTIKKRTHIQKKRKEKRVEAKNLLKWFAN